MWCICGKSERAAMLGKAYPSLTRRMDSKTAGESPVKRLVTETADMQSGSEGTNGWGRRKRQGLIKRRGGIKQHHIFIHHGRHLQQCTGSRHKHGANTAPLGQTVVKQLGGAALGDAVPTYGAHTPDCVASNARRYCSTSCKPGRSFAKATNAAISSCVMPLPTTRRCSWRASRSAGRLCTSAAAGIFRLCRLCSQVPPGSELCAA